MTLATFLAEIVVQQQQRVDHRHRARGAGLTQHNKRTTMELSTNITNIFTTRTFTTKMP